MKLAWKETAESQINDIYTFIAKDKPQAAKRWVETVYRRGRDIKRFPDMGRVVPEKNDVNVREVFEGAYRIIYVIDRTEQIVSVYMVVHGARLLERAEQEVLARRGKR